eukprot:scaffold118901_cov43-Tisochrysis_lutea.AAC.3
MEPYFEAIRCPLQLNATRCSFRGPFLLARRCIMCHMELAVDVAGVRTEYDITFRGPAVCPIGGGGGPGGGEEEGWGGLSWFSSLLLVLLGLAAVYIGVGYAYNKNVRLNPWRAHSGDGSSSGARLYDAANTSASRTPSRASPMAHLYAGMRLRIGIWGCAAP